MICNPFRIPRSGAFNVNETDDSINLFVRTEILSICFQKAANTSSAAQNEFSQLIGCNQIYMHRIGEL